MVFSGIFGGVRIVVFPPTEVGGGEAWVQATDLVADEEGGVHRKGRDVAGLDDEEADHQ